MTLINRQDLHAKLLYKEAEKWEADHAQQAPSTEDYVKYTAQALVTQNAQMITDDMQKAINEALLQKASYDEHLTITNRDAEDFAVSEGLDVLEKTGMYVFNETGYPRYKFDPDKFVKLMNEVNTTFNPSWVDSCPTEPTVSNALNKALSNHFWDNIKAMFEKAGYKVTYYCRDLEDRDNNRIIVELN